MTCWRRYALSSNRMLCIFRIEWWVGHELENILSIGASARLHQRMVRTIRRPDITKYLEIYVTLSRQTSNLLNILRLS